MKFPVEKLAGIFFGVNASKNSDIKVGWGFGLRGM